MAVGTDTRERPAARQQDTLPDSNEDIASLLLSGGEDDDDGEGTDDQLSAEEDELGLPGDPSEDDEDDGEGDGTAADEDGDASGDREPASSRTAANNQDDFVTAWAAKVRAKPLSIMQVPANRRAAVLQGAFAAERSAAVAELREPIRQQAEKLARDAYNQGLADAKDSAQSDTEFAEVKDLAENDLAGWAQLAHTEEGRAKVRRYLERLEQESNPGATKGLEAIRTAAAPLVAKLKANPEAFAALQAKQDADPRRYSETSEGLGRFIEDATEALANARVKASEPERREAEKRKNGAQHRSQLPRTAGGEGRSGGGQPDISMFAPAADDLRMGFREENKRR